MAERESAARHSSPQQSAASGQWASGQMRAERLAHDLGNYLTAISGLAQVGRLMKAAEAKDSYLTRIEAAVQDMSGMLREALANRPADLRESTDRWALKQLIDEVVGLLAPRFASKGVHLRSQFLDGIPTCRLARIPLKQVLVNLLDNALHATTAGGTVDLKVLPCNHPPGSRIWVQDTGVGIAKHLLGRICQPGYTTRADGYGLGLPVAREVVEIMHGGRLSIRSKVNQGTSVHVYLPC